MTDEVVLEGISYISSKRASELSGYAQDYIGQLARRGLIEAQRIGGLWYVSMESLTEYKKSADEYRPQVKRQFSAAPAEPDSIVSFDGRDYVSASRAARITSYNQDYIGQLARSGTVLARQIGNRWYVDRESLLAHKKEKDALLAAVQTQSVGIPRPAAQALSVRPSTSHNGEFFTYTRDDSVDLMPYLPNKTPEGDADGEIGDETIISVPEHNIPIHVDRHLSTRKMPPLRQNMPVYAAGKRKSRRSLLPAASVAVAVFTVAIVLSLGLYTLKDGATYTMGTPKTIPQSLTASASAALNSIGEVLEAILVPELVYKRVN
ncbi:MAG: hypothetical protein NUV59_00220 [Patescibacteria group bacterium]|nr:hypothetical protein [Patescibacteria group bacterium]